MHFSLNQLQIPIHLGVPASERQSTQIIQVTVEWDIDVDKSCISDDIMDTVDYFAIEQLIRHFPAQKSWHLLEKLHFDLLTAIKENFSTLKNLKLTITKYPFINGSVTITN